MSEPIMEPERESLIEPMLDEIFSKVEIEYIQSLPICTKENEYIFFYNIQVDDDNNPYLAELAYLYGVNSFDGTIDGGDFYETLGIQDLKDQIEGSLIDFDDDQDQDDDELEEEYEELYNWFVTLDFKENTTDKERIKLNRMYEVFKLLVPDGVLRDMYLSIGQDMFNYLENQTSL